MSGQLTPSATAWSISAASSDSASSPAIRARVIFSRTSCGGRRPPPCPAVGGEAGRGVRARPVVLAVDPGPLVATADRADKDHAACRALLEGDEGPLVTTALVIAEAAYLIDRQLGPAAEASLYASITGGQLEVASLDRDDWVRIRELVTTYADLRLG